MRRTSGLRPQRSVEDRKTGGDERCSSNSTENTDGSHNVRGDARKRTGTVLTTLVEGTRKLGNFLPIDYAFVLHKKVGEAEIHSDC